MPVREPRPPVGAVRVRAATPGWAGAFLRDLAASVAAAPRGTPVRIDSDGTAAVVVLDPRDDRTGPLVDAAARRWLGVVGIEPVAAPVGTVPAAGVEHLVAVPAPGTVPAERAPPPVPAPPRSCAGRARVGTRLVRPLEPTPGPEVPPGVRMESRAYWRSRGDGDLDVRLAWRVTGDAAGVSREVGPVAVALARRLAETGFPRAAIWRARSPRRAERRWVGRASGRRSVTPPWQPAWSVAPELAAREVPVAAPPGFPTDAELLRHVAVVGATGSGKSAWLLDVACAAIERGTAAVVVDAHGDVGPRLVGRLSPAARRRLVAVDPVDGRWPGPGVRVLGADGVPPAVEGAHLVAALHRLAGDGGETYWGFRIERVLETFVRRVQEEHGSLVDLFDLLTDPDRREAARLATRVPAVARFLEELPAILRRNPEYLAPAAARLSKVVLRDELARLLAPVDAGLPVDALLDDGRALVLRLPVGELGPEGSAFAATLLLSRIYLGRMTRPVADRARLTTLFVLDEAAGVSPRLLAEVLSEGRKFGVGVVLATQFPERLAPELRSAAAGTVGSHVMFRVPAASAVATGRWVGLPEDDARAILPELPPGVAVIADAGAGAASRLRRPGGWTPASTGAWEEALRATAREFPSDRELRAADLPLLDEQVLLAAYGLEARGERAEPAAIVRWIAGAPGAAVDPALVPGRLPALRSRGWVVEEEGVHRLTPAGLGMLRGDARTGATRETAEHRALLLGAFRRFAARGYRLEVLRQGRFDTRLPDARLCLLPPSTGPAPVPAARAAAIDRARSQWAWRFFDGRDVHVEAEVSGAERRERIRHDLAKARAAGAFLLVLVADDRRARRVRDSLRAMTDVPRRAQVWTIREAAGVRAVRDVPAPAG